MGRHVKETLLEKGVLEENILIPRSSEYDLREKKDCVKAVSGRNVVIHVAGVTGGIGYIKQNPAVCFYDNAAMSLNLIDAAYRAGVEKFIGVGSVCSYPKLAPIPFREENLWDGYPDEVLAPYGLAKKFMLAQSIAYRAQYGFNAVHLLLVNLYGPSDNFDPKDSHVIPAIIYKVFEAKRAGKRFIEAWGDKNVSREFVYVADAADGIVLAAEKYDKPEPVNLGSGMEITMEDLTNTICRLMHFNGEVRWDKSKPSGQPRRRLDVSRAELEFGFKARIDFEVGLKKTIDWWWINQRA